MSAAKTRDQIAEAADRLFYERGYEATSFAHIAEAVGLSRGNFYYHFKSKDEILDAVIALRAGGTQHMLDAWEAIEETAEGRIERFIEMLIDNRLKIMAHGCPVGSLCSELAKLDHASKPDAAGIFNLFRHWLAKQFCVLGRASDADRLAMHLLMRSQGIASLATAFGDESFIRREVDDMKTWLKNQISA